VNVGFVTFGFIGASVALLLLYYTTGVLLHFATFDQEAAERYTERLREETSFEALLAGIILYAASMGMAGAALIVVPQEVGTLMAAGYTFLTLGMLYFLRRMARITAVS
jgi:hypothetical protein